MQEYMDFISNNLMLSIAWVVIAVMLLTTVFKDKFSKFKGINPQQATLLINKEDAVVVDVRTAEEFKKGHVVNAKNIPLSQINEGKLNIIENKKNNPIIVVCATGARSSGAAAKLVTAGFEKVYSLSPGMSGWTAANLPTTKK